MHLQMHFLAKRYLKVFFVLLLVCTIGCGKNKGSETNMKLTENTKCEIVDEQQSNAMVKHGTGIIVFVDESKESEDAIAIVDALSKEVDVKVMLSSYPTDMIVKVPSIACINKGNMVEWSGDFEDREALKERFERMKNLRKENESKGCGDHCEFKIEKE